VNRDEVTSTLRWTSDIGKRVVRRSDRRETFNVLLNPAHQDGKRVAIVQTGEHATDPRLLK